MPLLQEVLTHLERNELDQGLNKCLDLVAIQPHNADAQHLLGIIHAKNRQVNLAIRCFEAAIKIDPQQAIFHNNISNAYKLIGNLRLAILHLHEALRLSPNNAESYNNLGSLYYTQGNISQAIQQFEKTIRLNPNSWEAHYNLGNCFIKTDKVLQAIEQYNSVLQLQSSHLNAKTNLAMAWVSLENYEAALSYLIEVVTKNPNHSELQGHLATAYLEVGQTSKAIEHYNIALNLDPNRAEWHHNLAVLYLRDKQQELAIKHFQASLNLEPNNPTAQHMLASLNNVPSADTPPPEYVASLFDQYASYYNHHVKNELKYVVPELLRQEISNFITPFTQPWQVLDLGCGTGLCGVYFRDLAKFSVGVDLSAQMLDQAKALGAYDALCCCNIVETIPGLGQERFDLILAADVLVYLGALEIVFENIASALKAEALFAFSIEEQEHSNQFVLQTTGRYAHSQAYIANLARQNNMHIETNQSITPRMQADEAISGRLYVLRKF